MRTIIKNIGCKARLLMAAIAMMTAMTVNAQYNTNINRAMLSVGASYERGLDATLSIEHETKYHNAWEYFAMVYCKYEKDDVSGHYTKKSFWNSYNAWHVGVAYKPCTSRGRNHHGNLRIGASIGSDRSEILGTVHVGYEHSYALKGGWELFYQIKEDIVFNGKDTFRTGVALGIKLPL